MASRAYTLKNIMEKKYNNLDFTGEWRELIGSPELKGSWIIWGNSGNGKTDFALKLAKYLCQFGKVLYNPLEEGISKSLCMAIERNAMTDVGNRILFLDQEPTEDLTTRLLKKRAPKVVIIDSFQYTQMNQRAYIQFKEQFPNTLFIWVSHAEGNHPAGRTGKFLKYDSSVKIHVKGYRATCVSRYGGGKPFTIWREGAEKYYGEIKHSNDD